MAGLDTTKISNILGTKIPKWLLDQLNYRSEQNSQDSRDNNNILFLTNKSAWIRLVSSIDIINSSDIEYFKRIVGDSIKDKSDLAKQFVLFGGTSKYLQQNSYAQRAGLGTGGSYGTLGDQEIQSFGYRPMPGITDVTVETLGKLGSLRQATINFKCWDKSQLDIIDALYFKLGFTMFLEWGNTFFYKAGNPDKLESTELYSIDPFRLNLTKEEINIQISKNITQSEGNYSAMLGMVTNFNFSYNQEGGYDCSLRLMGLGVLGDAIKINNPKDLPNILAEEIRLYNNTLLQIATAEEKQRQLQLQAQATAEAAAKAAKENEGRLSVEDFIKKYVTYDPQTRQVSGGAISYPSNVPQEFKYADVAFNTESYGQIQVIRRLKGFIPIDQEGNVKIQLDTDRIINLIDTTGLNLSSPNAWNVSDYTILNNISRDRNSNIEGKWNWDSRTSGLNYVFTIERQAFAETNEPNAIEKYYPVSIGEFARLFRSTISNKNNTYNLTKIVGESGKITSYTIRFSIPFTRDIQIALSEKERRNPDGTLKPPSTRTSEKQEVRLVVNLTFEDSSFIRNFTLPEQVIQPIDFIGNQAAIAAQNQQQAPKEETKNEGQENSILQIKQALELQSGLELTLRTIQIRALNRAIYRDKTKPDLEIGRRVFTFPIYSNTESINGKPFYSQIFSNGVFSNYIEKLINNTISEADPKNAEERFQIQAKYGFATQLMSGDSTVQDLQGKRVDYKELLNAYVVPYQINQEIIKGTTTNHPVYIPLGLLIMILNHSCTIYDTNNSSIQTPLVYVDFNPNLNFFLNNTKQLSTNPFKVLIPFEGSSTDYADLFSTEILNGKKTEILPLSGSKETTPLFNVDTNDLLSGQIPPIKFTKEENGTSNPYRGKLMNILLNIDYVIELVREFSLKDETNNIYLKTFLEQIISDVNKYLGNFNALRLAYQDASNTFQIVDDQLIPPVSGEVLLEPDNTTNLPLIGKKSIAKSLEIKTEVSSKLSNMIAISANADASNKATLSTNGDNFGFINTSYKDRYIPIKGDITNVTGSSKPNNDSLKAAAIQFNQTVSDFYSKINPSEANVSQATNYYIEKMSKIKNNEYPTRASTMIPISVNFTTDGVSGFRMGQGFTIPEELLPYTYNNRVVQGIQGLGRDHINKVGFVVTGLTDTISNNQWNTSVKASMLFLKNVSELTGSVKQAVRRDQAFGVNITNENTSISVPNTNFIGSNNQAKQVAETYLGRPITDQEWNQLIAATYAEASSNQTERAWVLAVILNRTRTRFLKASTIIDTLTRKNQFQAVTGTSANGYRPSTNYIQGPNPSQASSIYGAIINILPSVPKNYLYFTSNVIAAYGRGTDLTFLDNLKKQPGSKIIGQTIFSITA